MRQNLTHHQDLISLLEKSMSIAWICTPNLEQLRYINTACQHIWGHDQETLLEKPSLWRGSILPEDRTLANAPYFRCADGKNSHPLLVTRYRIRQPSGTVLHIEEQAIPLYNKNKELTGFAGLSQDVSHFVSRKELIQKNLTRKTPMTDVEMGAHELTQNLSRFILALAEKNRDVFWIRSSDYQKQIYVNPAYEKIWGRQCNDLMLHPENWVRTLLPDDLARINKSIAQREPDLKQDMVFAEWYRIRRPDGTIRWIEDTSYPLFSEDGQLIGFGGTCQDITQERKIAMQLKSAQEEAELADISKTEFISNISHDLKTPLHALNGVCELLLLEEHTPAQREHFNTLKQASETLINMVEEVLDFTISTKGEDRVDTRIKLKPTLDGLSKVLAVQAHKKGLQLRLHVDPDLPITVYMQSRPLRRIVTNLVQNAIKFTSHGSIDIDACLVKKTRRSFLQLKITDTGVGIPAEKLPYIFDRFYRVDPTYRSKIAGSGLGLSIVAQLVKQLGGEISAESTLMQGTIFTCLLPFRLRAPKEATAGQPSAFNTSTATNTDTTTLNSGQQKVLLVEDDKLIQHASTAMLQNLGCEVTLADTGERAIQAMAHRHFDCVFLDLGLPDIDGQEVLRHVRQLEKKEASPQAFITVLTAHAQEAVLEQCLKLGANAHLTKPATMHDLRQVLSMIPDREGSSE